jgi:hypothetical protein
VLYELAEPRLAEPSWGLVAMGKLETPVVAGVGGVAVFAAILSVFGGGSKETPTRPETRSTSEQRTESATAPGVPPNQDGPWRAACQEYAPYPIASTPSGAQPKGKREASDVPQSKIDLTTVSRGYKTIRQPSSIEGASEITIKDGKSEHKITVHKLLVGDLSSCIPPDELGKIRFVVATLPDPDKTEMRLEFDRYVTALEDAAALRGYNFTGYWFPWRPRDNSPSPKKEDEVEAQLLRKEQPGSCSVATKVTASSSLLSEKRRPLASTACKWPKLWLTASNCSTAITQSPRLRVVFWHLLCMKRTILSQAHSS